MVSYNYVSSSLQKHTELQRVQREGKIYRLVPMGEVLSKNSYIGRNQYYNWESHWALLSKTTPSKSANHGVYCTIGWSSRKSNVHRFLVFTLPDFLRTGSAQLVGWRRGGVTSCVVHYLLYESEVYNPCTGSDPERSLRRTKIDPSDSGVSAGNCTDRLIFPVWNGVLRERFCSLERI